MSVRTEMMKRLRDLGDQRTPEQDALLAAGESIARERAEDERQARVLNDLHVQVESARDALKARGTEEGRAFANLLASTFSQMRERIEADEPVGLLPHRIKRAVDAVLGTE